MLKAGARLQEIPLPPFKLEEDKKVVIYGTGDVAEQYYDKISKEYGEEKIAFFLEGQSIVTTFKNKKVITPEELKKDEVKDYLYILASFGSVSLMRERLRKVGITDNQIIPTMDRCNIEMLYYYEKKVKTIAIYPILDKKEDLVQVLELMRLYLVPNEEFDGNITIFYKEEENINDYVQIRKAENEKIDCLAFDMILVWDPKELYNKDIVEHPCVFCFHPEVIPHLESKILHCAAEKLLKEQENGKYRKIASKNLQYLMSANCNKKKAYVYGSGPSLNNYIKTLKSEDIEDGIRIVCNEFCENEAIMNLLKPQIYVLWDYGYFETKLHSTILKISKYIKNNNCILVVPDTAVRMLHLRYGISLDAVIGLNPYGKEINFPTPENMKIIRTDNVMTAFAVPLAATLVDEICIVGCDGMKEDGGWNHSEFLSGDSTKYCDVEVERMGKSQVFSKYRGICKYYEKLFTIGEMQGKVFKSITETYIPALRKRSEE